MSIFGAILGSIFSGLFGGLASPSPAPSAPAPGAEGINSAMGQIAPPPLAQSPVAGAVWSDLQRGLGQYVTSSLLRPLYGQAGQMQGEANRAALDAAFPELNPWEKAGVSATGPGIQAMAQENQVKLQEKQLGQQIEMQDKNIALEKLRLQVQERMNAISSAAQVQSAGISAAPAMAMVPFNQELTTAQTYRTQADEASVADTNLRGWTKDLATALMSGRSYNAGIRDSQSGIVSSVMARDLFGMLSGLNPLSALKFFRGYKPPVRSGSSGGPSLIE